MEFKSLVKNTSYLAVARMAQFGAGLITTKISAILLGTVGVGIVNQLNFLTQKMSQLSTLSMTEAVVKQIAENKDSKNAAELIKSSLKSYILLVSAFMVLSITILFFFASSITNDVFGDLIYLPYFFIGLFTFPLLVINSIPFALLKGFRNIKIISRARIGIVFVNLFVALPLIYFFRLDGAIAFVPISFLINLIFHYFYAQKLYFLKYNISIRSIFSAPFNSSFVKELFLFSGFGLTIGTYAIVSEFACRSIVVSRLGVDQIGLYSPIIMWGSIFTGFLLPSLSTYLYPRFCELKTKREISGLMNDALRLGSFMIVPLLFIGIPYRKFIISIFYSKEFINAAIYLPFHFLGIAFYVWWFVFSQAMTPTGRIKQYGVFQLFFYSINILVTYFFVKDFGLWGWMLKHIISPFIFFWIYSIYANKYMGFKLLHKNFNLMSYILISSFLLIVIDSFLSIGYLLILIIGPLLLIGTIFFLEQSEKRFILEKIKIYIAKIFK